jgi:hypothetical protein
MDNGGRVMSDFINKPSTLNQSINSLLHKIAKKQQQKTAKYSDKENETIGNRQKLM